MDSRKTLSYIVTHQSCIDSVEVKAHYHRPKLKKTLKTKTTTCNLNIIKETQLTPVSFESHGGIGMTERASTNQ